MLPDSINMQISVMENTSVVTGTGIHEDEKKKEKDYAEELENKE